MCVSVWACKNHEHLPLSRGSLISVHAGTSPARSHPQLLYLMKGWGNHFHRCLFRQALINKANISKAVWKNDLKAREGKQKSLGEWTNSSVMIRKPKALCVWECQMIIWQTESPDLNTQLENTPATSSTHILFVIFRLLQLSAPPRLNPQALLPPCQPHLS